MSLLTRWQWLNLTIPIGIIYYPSNITDMSAEPACWHTSA